MNKKWRILLGICLVVMVCVPIVTASIQLPTPQNSFTQSPSDGLFFTKNTYNVRDNIRIPQGLPDIQLPSSSGFIRKPDFTAMPDNPGGSESIRSIFEKYRTLGTSPQSGTYISKEEAVQIALGVFPGITLTKPIETATRYVDCKGLPLKRDCIIVTLIGYNPEEDPETSPFLIHENGTIGPRMYTPYGGMVYIDAISGEVLFVAYLI
jgi:hypothetical protein